MRFKSFMPALAGLLGFNGRTEKQTTTDTRQLSDHWNPWKGLKKRAPFMGRTKKRPESVMGYVRKFGSRKGDHDEFRAAFVVNPAISRRAQRRMD